MKRVKRLEIGLSVLLMAVSPIVAEEQPTQIQFVRPLGMGGAFTAVADDHNIFGFNPAGMVQRSGAEITLLEIALGGSEDLKKAADFVSDNEARLDNYDILTPTEQQQFTNEIINEMVGLTPRVYVAADVASFVSGPKFFGLPIHGGFGALGVADGSFEFGVSALTPNISYEINNDVVIPLALAKRFDAPLLPGTIGVGVTGKFIHRNQVQHERLNLLQLDDVEAPDPAKGRGIGSDVGLLYQPTKKINVGIMVQDFLGTKMGFDATDGEPGVPATPERDTVIRPRTNVGIALFPEKLLWILPTGNRLTLAADVRDVLNQDQHLFFTRGFHKPLGEDLWPHVHLGAEYRWWFLRLRGGAYQGYPSFGLGLDIPFVKLDYAFYSQELGARAGDLRQGNHVVSFALKFGTGHTEARARIREKKESETVSEPAPETQVVPAATEPAPAEATPPVQQ